MFIKVKGKSVSAKLVKQISAAKTVDDLKGVMLEMLKKSSPMNNATQGVKRGRI